MTDFQAFHAVYKRRRVEELKRKSLREWCRMSREERIAWFREMNWLLNGVRQ